MSSLTKVLFEKSLTDKLASNDSRALPIVAGSGMILAGGSVPVTLAVLAKKDKQFERALADLDTEIQSADTALEDLALKRTMAEEDALNAFLTKPNNVQLADPKAEALRLKNIANSEASMKQQQRIMSEIDNKEVQEQLKKLSELQKEQAALKLARKNSLWTKINHNTPSKYGFLLRAGLIGVPIALIAGGAGLAGYNLYKRHQENKPWYKKFFN